jgi:hypothetical protein
MTVDPVPPVWGFQVSEPKSILAADLYHTGIVVDDVELAQKSLTAVAGYTWRPVQRVELTVRMEGQDHRLALEFVYSEHAPYIELVKRQPAAAPWRGDVGSAPHHLGYFVDDLAGAARDLEANGYVMEACGVIDGVAPSIFAYYNNADGLRLEIVDRTVLADLSERFPEYVRTKKEGTNG